MRLIDANYFQEQITKATLKNNIEPEKGIALLELIDSVPTAYDIDKVKKVLNMEVQYWEESGRIYEDKKELGIAEGFRKALKIVEDGGEHYHTTADGGM